ncbi:MAG: hypothetical protein NTV43_18420 [Methylococcales bacterium]|nr:hypothetical protein [Methylococcales bacterium]
MPSYNKMQQGEEKSNQRSVKDRQGFVRQQASSKIKPFDWGDDKLGIRRADVAVFKAAALAFDHFILVRETNVASLPYIGNKNFYPKPMDCKAKTAGRDVLIPFASRHIYSKAAGLVVDPTIVGAKAFDEGKFDKAMVAWDDFLKDKTPEEKKTKVFRRRGAAGIYAVDLDINSEYYGCLMISRANGFERRIVDGQTVATNEGNPHFDETAVRANPAWRNAEVWDAGVNESKSRMQYIHGDYDLYALLNVDNPNEPTVVEWVNGIKNYCSASFRMIQDFINKGIGSPMVQHGDQFRYKHQGDKLFVFYPTGMVYMIDETGQSIQEIFALVYGVNA